jgi:protein gp37
MTKTTIEWCDEVWNPVTGCQKVSAGCKNCYAERIASRFWGARKFTDVMIHPERLDAPKRWKKPHRVFVNSMSDLFHPTVPFDFIGDVYDEMICHPKHTFIVLTKRPQRMLEFSNWYGLMPEATNVWLGVSVENQQAADERIPLLLQTPAAVRFVSVEPMLGPVNLGNFLCKDYSEGRLTLGRYLDWVIAGCESGPGARPFSMDWARDLRDQCVSANVPFFFKQGRVNGEIVKMPELDGQTWAQYPEARR